MELDYLRHRAKTESTRAAEATDSVSIIAHRALARAYLSRIAQAERAATLEAEH